MTEEQIFLAALEQPDASRRTAYLDSVCGTDTALRRQVEELLAAHFKSGAFLDEPLGKQLGSDSANSNYAETVFASSSSAEVAVANERSSEQDSGVLQFLEPSTHADSLGRIGHYEVLQVLGKGGFGIVFRAFDEVLQRVVALKVLAPAIAATSPARKRFLREAQASARVRHENVVQVYAVEELPIPYLVMEFIAGETLQQRLDRKGPLDVAEIVSLARQVAAGLAAAHETGLIHRDIKPGNILIEGGVQGRVKITDFGLARAADDASLTQSGMLAGTPMFMAPEQAQGGALDQRADLFSLGSVLYVMASGRPPFRAATTFAVLKRVVEETPRPVRDLIPETPQWLCDIIAKLHAKKPGERFQSSREVADVLANCESQLKEHSRVRDLSLISRGKAQPTAWWKWAAVTALVLPLLALGLYLVTRPGSQPKVAGRGNIEQSTPEPKPVSVAKQEQLPSTFTSRLGMEFVKVPKGKAWLGGGKDKPGDLEVEFPADFYLGKYEVTQEDWEKVMGKNPRVDPQLVSAFSRKGGYKDAVKDISDADLKRSPVENVSISQCLNFVDKLNKLEKETGWEYRLPTELEWEYACRGGPMSNQADSTFDFYFARPTNTLLPAQANFNNVLQRPCKVGSYEPNVLGLCDMHGNVEEWCEEWVARGGGFQAAASDCRAENRWMPIDGLALLNLGLRLVRVRFGTPAPEVKTVSAPVAKQEPPSAVAPFDAPQARAHQEAWAKHLGVPVEFTNSIGMKFMLIPPGEFMMGSTAEEIQASIKAIQQAAPQDVDWQRCVQSESPRHKVLLTRPYYLGTYEVTQREYEVVMGKNPSRFAKTGPTPKFVAKVAELDTTQFAVDSVSWNDAAEFCAKLSQRDQLKPVYFRANNAVTKLDGKGYRLPTEAQWEFGCRAGTTTRYSGGNGGDSELQPSGWFWSNAGQRMHPVGELKANSFGLFDMHGNASEFVEDAWAPGYYEQFTTAAATDPAGAPPGEGERISRVIRGGYWLSGASECRSGSRFANNQLGASEHVGFRVVLPVEAVKAGVAKEEVLERADSSLGDAKARLGKAIADAR